MLNYFNPYSNAGFFDFFFMFFHRLFQFIIGRLSLHEMASDEVQIFVLCSVAGSAALTGTFLILRKMAMLANSLSHTILLGIVIAFMISKESQLAVHHAEAPLQIMFVASILMGILTAFLTEFITKTGKLQEDASTGLVFTSLFALGIVLVTLLTRNAHIGIEAVMGNVDALHLDDFSFVGWIFAINLCIVILLFKEYMITAFDPALAKSLGYSLTFFNYLLMVQASMTIIGAFRATGVLMVLAFLTGPVLSARLLTNDLKKMLLIAILLGFAESLIGVALTRHILTDYDIALSTAGVVVCMIVLGFTLSIAWSKFRTRWKFF